MAGRAAPSFWRSLLVARTRRCIVERQTHDKPGFHRVRLDAEDWLRSGQAENRLLKQREWKARFHTGDERQQPAILNPVGPDGIAPEITITRRWLREDNEVRLGQGAERFGQVARAAPAAQSARCRCAPLFNGTSPRFTLGPVGATMPPPGPAVQRERCLRSIRARSGPPFPCCRARSSRAFPSRRRRSGHGLLGRGRHSRLDASRKVSQIMTPRMRTRMSYRQHGGGKNLARRSKIVFHGDERGQG